MQKFYTQLKTASTSRTGSQSLFVRLTQASRFNIAALPNQLGWSNWDR